MLNTHLTTNEVKDSAGAEVEFLRLSSSGREAVFAKNGEAPNLPNRISIKHAETGEGIKKRRRSLIRFDKTSMSTVDATLPVVTSAYVVVDTPVGAVTNDTELTTVLAYLNSFLSLDGTGTTCLFAGTGSGTKVLREGSL